MKSLTYEQRENLLCSALEGGSNYWYYLPDLSMLNEATKGQPLVTRMIEAIRKGASIPVHDIEDQEEKLGELNKTTIREGEELMAKQQPEYYKDIIYEDDDASTADVWLQFCVMKEIVYG